MASSVLHAAGIVAQVSVKINRLKLHQAKHNVAPIVQNPAVLSQIKHHADPIVQNPAVKNKNL